jgi:TolA-binding protein
MDSLPANDAGKPQSGQVGAAPGAAQKDEDSAAKRQKEVADLYYRSMAYYRDGQLGRARDGFVQVLSSGLIPPEMQNTIRAYIADIDRTLARENQKK